MAGTRKSFVYAAAGRYTEFFLFLMGTLVLSRLLTPTEVGLFAAANSVVAFAQNIKNFGTTDFLIQKEKIDEVDVQRALGIAVIFSWGIALILMIFSSIIADFFGEPRMQTILIIVGASFLFLPISSIADAQMMRDMKFGLKSIIGVLAAAANLSVAIWLALDGYGAISIAWATLAGNVAIVVFTIIIAHRYVSFRPLFTGVKEALAFGSWLTATSLIRNFGYNGYILIIGKMLDFAALGLYMRAVTVVERFTTILLEIIRSVALPSFAELRRNETNAGPKILDALHIMANFLWPIYGFVGVMAQPIVITLFGWQWTESIPLVQLLSISVIASFNMTALIPTVLTAYGHVKPIFWFSLVIYSVRIIGVLFAVQHGLEAVVYAIILSSIVSVFLYLWALKQFFNVSYFDTFRQYMPAAITTVISLIPCLFIRDWTMAVGWHPILQLSVSFVVSFGIWLFLLARLSPLTFSEFINLKNSAILKLKALRSSVEIRP